MKKAVAFVKNALLRVLAAQNPVSRKTVRLKRAYRIAKFNKGTKKRLEICGGIRPLNHEAINVDILDYPTVDVVADIIKPLPFEDSSIDHIVSVATLEHFNINDLKTVLNNFFRVLKPGGVLEIGVPSLKKIIHYYQQNGCDDLTLRYLHGGLKDTYDIHLSILDFERMQRELEIVGFTNIVELPYDFPRHDEKMMMKIQTKKKT